MSKERLEEIKKIKLDPIIYQADDESDYVDFISKADFNWLIEQAEQVQELERVNKQLKGNLSVYKGYYKNTLKINEDVIEQNNRYRESFEKTSASLAKAYEKIGNWGFDESQSKQEIKSELVEICLEMIKALEGEE